ncbi:MAG: hypothetical protein K2W95_34640 [Candidatus Obscuribacterales bacterium]|nr:hypothetical protein [Candidatus Obscuribacterales bacterium]
MKKLHTLRTALTELKNLGFLVSITPGALDKLMTNARESFPLPQLDEEVDAIDIRIVLDWYYGTVSTEASANCGYVCLNNDDDFKQLVNKFNTALNKPDWFTPVSFDEWNYTVKIRDSSRKIWEVSQYDLQFFYSDRLAEIKDPRSFCEMEPNDDSQSFVFGTPEELDRIEATGLLPFEGSSYIIEDHPPKKTVTIDDPIELCRLATGCFRKGDLTPDASYAAELFREGYDLLANSLDGFQRTANLASDYRTRTKYIDALQLKAERLFMQGSYDEAAAALSLIPELALEPELARLKGKSALLFKSRCLHAAGQDQKALDLTESILHANEYDGEAHYQRSVYLKALGNEIEASAARMTAISLGFSAPEP